jgi:hypothetical protein
MQERHSFKASATLRWGDKRAGKAKKNLKSPKFHSIQLNSIMNTLIVYKVPAYKNYPTSLISRGAESNTQ